MSAGGVSNLGLKKGKVPSANVGLLAAPFVQ